MAKSLMNMTGAGEGRGGNWLNEAYATATRVKSNRVPGSSAHFWCDLVSKCVCVCGAHMQSIKSTFINRATAQSC